jgi:hypothetical protein
LVPELAVSLPARPDRVPTTPFLVFKPNAPRMFGIDARQEEFRRVRLAG